MTAASPGLERFRADYALHRLREGRAHRGAELLSLPYLASGPLARQWQVRTRSFKALIKRVVIPLERGRRKLRILDLGAGNGWLSYRLALRGHACTAIDIRDDGVDGLGAAEELRLAAPFDTLVAGFEALPLPSGEADLAIFNASLHYASDLDAVLREAARCVRRGGTIAIVDSPFYRRAADGEAMVREKYEAKHLARIDAIEFLTPRTLAEASALRWRRHRVLYPPWYEARLPLALLKGARRPSRFDIWTAQVQ